MFLMNYFICVIETNVSLYWDVAPGRLRFVSTVYVLLGNGKLCLFRSYYLNIFKLLLFE